MCGASPRVTGTRVRTRPCAQNRNEYFEWYGRNAAISDENIFGIFVARVFFLPYVTAIRTREKNTRKKGRPDDAAYSFTYSYRVLGRFALAPTLSRRKSLQHRTCRKTETSSLNYSLNATRYTCNDKTAYAPKPKIRNRRRSTGHVTMNTGGRKRQRFRRFLFRPFVPDDDTRAT